MTTRSERERQQRQNERYKVILAKLIAKEENKYCADCLSKGPRWVSWNLGVLLCIRCSGIHRSLGVHISKVKSVNLDTWTTDQIIKLCGRGNGWAKDYYEATLPKDFKRPSSDSSLEYFIRDKYEKRKYSGKEVPLRSIEEFNIYDDDNQASTKNRKKDISGGVNPNRIAGRFESPPSVPRPKTQIVPSITTTTPPQNGVRAAQTSSKPSSSAVDLLGLDTPAVPAAPSASLPESRPPPSSDLTMDLFASIQPNGESNSQTSGASESNPANTTSGAESKLMSKDSILSLYSQSSPIMNQFGNSNPYAGTAGQYGMAQNPAMTYGQQQAGGMPQMGYAAGMANPYNMQPQSVGMPGMVGGYPVQNMQAMQQQQQAPQFQWQQQQMQQQMQNMHLGAANSLHPSSGGMRSYSSMPQMTEAQNYAYSNQFASGGLAYNGMAASQPSLVAPTPGTGTGGWGNTGGETLSHQLWK